MELESLDVVIPVTGRGSVGGCDGGSTCDNTNKRGEKETITLQHATQWQSRNQVLVIIQCHPLVMICLA